MKTFSEIMDLTRTIGSAAAFGEQECAVWYDLLTLLPGGRVIEIGLQFGRSTSIAAQVIADEPLEMRRRLRYYGVDPFTDPPEARSEWLKLVAEFDDFVPTVFVGKTEDAVNNEYFPTYLHLALVDGDHSEQGVRTDCRILLPRIVTGGHVCFHDYGRESLPEVYPTVIDEMRLQAEAGRKFVEIGVWGTLGVYQRL